MDDIIELQKRLSEENHRIYVSETIHITKSAFLAYICFFFFAGFGIHKFYMGYPLQGILYMFLWLGGFANGLLFIPLLIFWIIDLFRIPAHCKMSVEKRKREVINKLLATQ